MLHKNIPLGDIHYIHNWEVANAAALAALVPVAGDRGKLAWKTDTNDFYFLANHVGPVWIAALGPQGPQGYSILSGIIAPTGGDGANGDFYLNTVTSLLYGPKAADVWPAGVSLIGPPGATGAQGDEGDSGIQGIQGVPGAAGANGVDGKTVLSGVVAPGAGVGVDGDFYLNTATSMLYGPKAAGAWPAGVSLVGATGAAGTNGTNGTNGVGVPIGGALGQVLAKASATDYDFIWKDPSTGLPVFDLATYATAAGGNYSTGWANAMAALETAGGGIIQVPAGVTDIAGPLLDTGRANAQLLLPSRHAVNAESITVVIRGVRPPPTVFSVVGDTPVPDNHSVLRSTLITGSGGQLLGGKGPVGAFADLSMVSVILEDVTFRMPSNPTHSAVDLSHMTGCVVDDVIVDTGSYYVQGFTQPTTATSYGIKFPKNGNGADTRVGCVNIAGMYTGVRISEHTNAEQINAWGCLRAAEFDYGQHASHIKRLMAVHCPRAIVATNGQSQVDIDQLNIEHAASGWFAPVYDIDDANNYWRGRARWHVVLANVGVDGSFSVNGAEGVELARIGYPFAPGINNKTVSYTATMYDAGKIIRINAAGATTLTISPDSTTLFAIGTEIHLQQVGAGAVTITAGAGVTINRPASQTLATKEQYAVATIKKVAANSWVAFGMLGAV